MRRTLSKISQGADIAGTGRLWSKGSTTINC